MKKRDLMVMATAEESVQVVPPGGVFGNLDRQFRESLTRLAEEQASIMNEVVAVVNTTNQILRRQVLGVAKRRLDLAREYAVEQGFDNSPDEE